MQSFLDQLNKSSVRSEVLAALAVQSSNTTRSMNPQADQPAQQRPDRGVYQQRPTTNHGNLPPHCSEPTNSLHDRIYAPLEIVAATVKSDGTSPLQQSSVDGVGGANNYRTTLSNGRASYASDQPTFRGGDRLASYFGERFNLYTILWG